MSESTDFPTQGFDVGYGLSYARIESNAAFVRKVLQLSTEDAVPGVTLFERLRRYETAARSGAAYSLDYAVADLPGGIEAETRFEPTTGRIVIVLSSATYDALESDVPRARFCLCHEIGHAVCHCDLLVRLSGIPHREAALARGTSKHPRYRDSEWQANAFAGALLIPARGLAKLEIAEGLLSLSAITRTYVVSSQCGGIRLSVWETHRKELFAGGVRTQG